MIPRHSIHALIHLSDFINLMTFKDASPDEIGNFEKEFARICGCKYGVLTGSCRGALYTLLKIRKIKNVHLQPYTCKVVADAVRYADCKLSFEDIELDTYGLSYESLKAKTVEGALIITHLYGCPSRDYKRLLSLAAEKGLFVIEDAAQSLGARYEGKPVGSLGDCAIFSFDLTKNTPVGAGGILVTNSEEIYTSVKRAMEQARHFARGDLLVRMLLVFIVWLTTGNRRLYSFLSWLRERAGYIDTRLTMPEYGRDGVSGIYSCRFPTSLLSLASGVLGNYSEVTEARIKNAGIYHEYFRDRANIAVLPWGDSGKFRNVFLRYPVRINNIPKRELWGKFRQKGIDVGDWFSDNILDWPQYKKYDCHCPNSNTAYEAVINLPVHQQLTKEDIEKVRKVVEEVC